MAVIVDELKQFVDGFFLRDVLLDAYLAAIETNLSTGSSNIAVVSIGHLAGAVDDTAHDANLQTN